MPGRSLSSANGYRYGFNGKENDNEVKGVEGSQQDYGMRIYDPRLGRFLSVDPITKDYPWYTPFQFAGNKPIAKIDLDGLEDVSYLGTKDSKTGKTQLVLVTDYTTCGTEILGDNHGPKGGGFSQFIFIEKGTGVTTYTYSYFNLDLNKLLLPVI